MHLTRHDFILLILTVHVVYCIFWSTRSILMMVKIRKGIFNDREEKKKAQLKLLGMFDSVESYLGEQYAYYAIFGAGFVFNLLCMKYAFDVICLFKKNQDVA